MLPILLAGLLGAIYLGTCMFLSLRKSSNFTPPVFPHLISPSTHNDEYARHHGLLTDFNRDSWTMTENQCDASFHPLWSPLYDSKIEVDSRGGHTLARQSRIERDMAASRELACVKVVNNSLYLSHYGHMPGGSRTEAAISLLERAVTTSTEPLADVQFCLSSQDQPDGGTFSLSRRADQKDIWLAPDFGFWAWPEPGVGSYVGLRQRIRQVEAKVGGWQGKKKELFWRGATWIGKERQVREEEGDTLGKIAQSFPSRS
jgi:hypothetical protein